MTPSSAAGIESAEVVFSTPMWRGHLLYTFILISEEKGYDTTNGMERRERESLVYLPFCWENKEAKPTAACCHLPHDQKHYGIFITSPGDLLL